jgi:hypothetical protein
VNIVLLDEAQRRFEAEFTQTMEHVGSWPEAGQRYRLARNKLIQHVLRNKAQCHIYYFYDRARQVIEVHSIWGARRGRGPKL